MDALDRERSLVDQRIEQAALIGGQKRARLVAVDADHADRAAPGAHGQEQALGPGQSVGPSSRGAIVLPCPGRRSEVRIVQRVFRRVAGLDGDRAVLRQEQNDAQFQHRRGLVSGSPQQIVERGDAGELAAEGIELLGRARPCPCREGLRADPRGKIGDEHGDQHEEQESRHVGRSGDGEGVERRQEEKVVAERGGDAGDDRGCEAVANRDRDHGDEEHEIDVFDAKQRLDQNAHAERDSDGEEADRIGANIEG